MKSLYLDTEELVTNRARASLETRGCMQKHILV